MGNKFSIVASILLLTSKAQAVADVSCQGAACQAYQEDSALLQTTQSTQLASRDLQRAKQVIPGKAFMVAHADDTNEMLNKHLLRLTGGKAKACEDFSLAGLDALTKEIDKRAHPELQKIYESNSHPNGKDWKDPRGVEGAFLQEEALSNLSHDAAETLRAEKKCYDAAMRFTHSLADSTKKSLLQQGFAVPLLPKQPAHMSALQADPDNGENIFGGNCAACHAGGTNSVVPEKTLKKEALETNGMYDMAKIEKQVTNGAGAMPAFGERIGPDDIEDVAAYVYAQAQADKW